MTERLKRTALYQIHTSLGARIVPFAGWEMPIQYSGILHESRWVRQKGGLFDVSHMGRINVTGPQAAELLDWLQTGHIGNLGLGKARYSLVCNENGGIIDDTVTYRLGDERFLVVCNAGNREPILSWIDFWKNAKYSDTLVEDITLSTAMIAVQGPSSAAIIDRLCPGKPSALKYFSSLESHIEHKNVLIGRTGYTGEDGFEVIIEATEGSWLWQKLVDEEMVSCGLGARDILRLEAGLPLHGNDIDQTTSPLEAGLERFVRLEKDFVGAEALREQQAKGIERKLVGLLVEGRSLARPGYTLQAHGEDVGYITSGGYSPTFDRNIGMGYLPKDFAVEGQRLGVAIRGRLAEAVVTGLPFYRRKRDQ